MRFIEMSGATLREVVNSDEIPGEELRNTGLEDDSIVRVNQQGDIELRRTESWDVIGGLIGDLLTTISAAI